MSIIVIIYDFATCFSKTALSFKIWKALCLSTQRNNATWFFAIRFILFLSCSWHIIKWSPQSALVYLTNIQTWISLHYQIQNEKLDGVGIIQELFKNSAVICSSKKIWQVPKKLISVSSISFWCTLCYFSTLEFGQCTVDELCSGGIQ